MLSFRKDLVAQKFVFCHVTPVGSLNAAGSRNTAIFSLRQSYLQWLFDPIISETHTELNAKQQLESLLQMWIPCPGPSQHFIQLEPRTLYRRYSGWGVRLTTHFRSVPRLRMKCYTSPHLCFSMTSMVIIFLYVFNNKP